MRTFLCCKVSLGFSLGPLHPSFLPCFPCFGVDLFPLLLVRILITRWSIKSLQLPLSSFADFESELLEERFSCSFLFSRQGLVPGCCNFTLQVNIDFRDPFRSCFSHGLNTTDCKGSQPKANPGKGLAFFDSSSVLILT